MNLIRLLSSQSQLQKTYILPDGGDLKLLLISDKHFSLYQNQRQEEMYLPGNMGFYFNECMETPKLIYYVPALTENSLNIKSIAETPEHYPTEEDWTHKLKELTEKIDYLEHKLSEVKEENKMYKMMVRPKRRYSQRRKNLEKKYRCNVENCKSCYSSSIALKSHLKKKHKAQQ